MALTSIRPEAGLEIISGYSLRQRLGAGGYGEVWLADAPGDLKKAIKIVYGSLEQDRAAGEFRSLQRIRAVHHPFLLSLERIEIVDQQLVIVTELAEGSLHDRFVEYRNLGKVGIPRNRLLGYMRDAAEALDYLLQKHELQHLDIKPANLLLVADRVKVADFGLVKDLGDNNQSIIGGLTPAYSSPEMFDGCPGRFSDQYSLAVLYQELLTGQMPFKGKTTAQLATQHLHKQPDLEPLPTRDRNIIAKALSKNPERRFRSCLELVESLFASDSAPRPQAIPTAAASPRPVARTTSVAPRKSSSFANSRDIDRRRPHATPVVELSEIDALPAIPNPRVTPNNSACLFIGLGGAGTASILRYREMVLKNPNSASLPYSWLVIDTDPNMLSSVAMQPAAVQDKHSIHPLLLPLEQPQHYQRHQPGRFSPLSRRWIYNIPRSKITEGVRPLAVLAMLDHAEEFLQKIGAMIRQLKEDQLRLANGDTPVDPAKIYLVSSAHGGTGSALLCEAAFAIRTAAQQLRFNNYSLESILTLAADPPVEPELRNASAMSLLSELLTFNQNDQGHPGLPHGLLPPVRGNIRPFDSILALTVDQFSIAQNHNACAKAVAETLELIVQTGYDPTSRVKPPRPSGDGNHPSQPLMIRTACVQPLSFPGKSSLRLPYLWCLDQLQKFSLALVAGTDSPPSSDSRRDTVSSSMSSHDTTVDSASEDRLLQMLATISKQIPITAGQWVEQTENFLASSADRVQLSVGLPPTMIRVIDQTSQNACEAMLEKMVSGKANWQDMQEVQHLLTLRLADAKRNLANIRDLLVVEISRQVKLDPQARLVSALKWAADRLADNERGTPPNETDLVAKQLLVHNAALRILEVFAERLSGIFRAWQESITSLHLHLRTWTRSLLAELNLNPDLESAEKLERALDLPEPVRIVGSRVRSGIDLALRRLAGQWLKTGGVDFSASNQHEGQTTATALVPTRTGLTPLATNATINRSLGKRGLSLPELTRVSCDLSRRIAKDVGVDIGDDSPMGEDSPSDSLGSLAKRIQDATPRLLRWGGKKRFFLMLPNNVSHVVAARIWREICGEPVTIISSPLDQPKLLCEGQDIAWEHIINSYSTSSQTGTLAERIHSRSDIQWIQPQ